MSLSLSKEKMASIDLRKQKVISLAKERGIFGEKAQVVLAIDVSGSMQNLYYNGTVQSVLERLIPLALQFDDNHSIDAFAFHNSAFNAGTIDLKNLEGFAQTIQRFGWGGTEYAPVLQMIFENSPFGTRPAAVAPAAAPAEKQGFFKSLFGGAKTEAPVAAVAAVKPVVDEGLTFPTYVIFLTDGDNSDHSATEALVRSLSNVPIFFQFVGIGSERFSFLNKLDDLKGRFIDNAGFFTANDINKMTDDALYDNLLKEFPSWLLEMRRRGKIK